TDGYYLHDEMNLTDTLAISGGYRHDQARFRFRPSAPERISMEQDLFTAGVNYNFLKNSHVYVSFSKSFRYPVLDELFNFFTNTINTGLLPQQSDNYEAGIRHFFTDDLSAGINLFQVDTAQEIFFNPANFANENQPGKTRRNGVEVYAAKKFDRVSLRGSYTYTDSKIKDGLYAGKEVPDVPQHQVSGEIQFYVGGGVTAALNGTYIGERPFISDFSNAFGPQDDYLILNAKVKYRRNRYTAFLDINNLTNEAYSEYGALGGFPVEQAFFPSPEINFILGVSADF
ncbi:MAG: TonB-dependent receptor, partial [Desulfobacterales bacterium]|nr:TonB-dependent receptor [Desulfobacterales bacterium]